MYVCIHTHKHTLSTHTMHTHTHTHTPHTHAAVKTQGGGAASGVAPAQPAMAKDVVPFFGCDAGMTFECPLIMQTLVAGVRVWVWVWLWLW